MQNSIEEPFAFKFHWLNDKGTTTSVFRKQGRFDGEILTLDKAEIPAAAIAKSIVRENRIVLAVHTSDPQEPVIHLLFQPSTKQVTEKLKLLLDVARSRSWAQFHREELGKKGIGHTYREEACPVCGATLILSGMPRSPQIYCHFCDSLTTIGAGDQVVKQERLFKICDECGMYSKPRRFTIFYFYFLLFVYGWRSQMTWRCPACMRGDAWKMLFGNFLFVLGVPVAIAQLIRCYGGDVVGGTFKGLDTGNLRARKGDLQGALDLYRAILDRAPHSAGVKYNLGMALLAQDHKEQAAEAFNFALQDCVNYVPAYHRLKALYTVLGKTEQLKELERLWSDGEEDEPEQSPVSNVETA